MCKFHVGWGKVKHAWHQAFFELRRHIFANVPITLICRSQSLVCAYVMRWMLPYPTYNWQQLTDTYIASISLPSVFLCFMDFGEDWCGWSTVYFLLNILYVPLFCYHLQVVFWHHPPNCISIVSFSTSHNSVWCCYIQELYFELISYCFRL